MDKNILKKDLKHQILNNICTIIDKKKEENKGKLPYGCMTEILQDLLPVAPWLTRDKIYGYYRTIWTKKKKDETHFLSPLNSTNQHAPINFTSLHLSPYNYS